MKTMVFAEGALQVQEQQLDQALAVFHIQEHQVIATSQSKRQKNSHIPLQRLSEKDTGGNIRVSLRSSNI